MLHTIWIQSVRETIYLHSHRNQITKCTWYH